MAGVEGLVAVVMAGGAGERLRPLTDVRAKPAVPFGGTYRIIDFTLSNCINSGVRRIHVLTQYKSHSLSRHLRTGWNFLSRRMGQFLDEVPAQMQTGSSWYSGTADAVRQNLPLLRDSRSSNVLILSGDHIYKMDYRGMLRFHEGHEAALTLAAVRVPVAEAAGAFGVLEVDETGRLTSFVEKPEAPAPLPGTQECLANMGVYLASPAVLERWLEGDAQDISRDVIPRMLAAGELVAVYDFSRLNRIEEYEYQMADGRRRRARLERASDSDHWKDVGTLEAYWRANLDLVSAKPRFNLYGEQWPVFNSPAHFPPAKFVHDSPGRTGVAIQSLVCEGVIVSGASVRRSVLCPGVYLHSYAQVEDSVLLGGSMEGGLVQETRVGRGCRIRNAVIDKDVHMAEGTVLGYDRAQDEARGLRCVPLPGGGHLVAVPKGWNL
ncbi:MAG TPA: sugar phosphate nucleotidyltransferase [Myxococcota bacterium]|nr:sugar phosphate nucleotidyltransferase [Myxococcota bacterium]HRY92729.1 sugar phosphate nucleotidyltransferase [Myxococcota bacterium]HSA23486.1 sugar phosphate nucleotidyltransferase [Myxococcota bacterium]